MKLICVFFLFSPLFALLFVSTGSLCAALTEEKIVFSSNRDGNLEIYAMDPDGTQQINLSRHFADDFDPVWSPSGEEILFVSNRGGQRDLYLMNADGKNVRKVFATTRERLYPTWAPSGEKFAYLLADEWAIYTATPDGKTVEKVADTGKGGGHPTWSPDGLEIAFTLAGAAKIFDLFWEASRQLHVVNLQTGEGETLFTAQKPNLTHPAWSPKGDRFAFSWIDQDLWKEEVWAKWGLKVFDFPTIYVASRQEGCVSANRSSKGTTRPRPRMVSKGGRTPLHSENRPSISTLQNSGRRVGI